MEVPMKRPRPHSFSHFDSYGGSGETDPINRLSQLVTSDPCRDSSIGATPLPNLSGARLLIVDDEDAPRKVLAVMLEQSGFVCTTLSSAAEVFTVLQEQPMDAVIADLNMPGISGMTLLTEIRQRYPNLVFLMATGVDDVRLAVQAMRQGADDYLIKPLQVDLILVSLEHAFHKKYLERELESYRQNLEAMVRKRTVQLQRILRKVEQSYVNTLDALGAVTDLRDDKLTGHSRRVALCSLNILRRMNGTPEQLKNLAMGAWLHDIGKLAIPDAILFKPGPLTAEERRIIQDHVQIGYDLVKRIPFLADAAEILFTHHERWDGSGYPRGLKGTDIPLSARIFAVADTFDAMTSDRPYRSPLSFPDARNEIERLAGTLYDSQVVHIFLGIPDETWQTIRQETSILQISAALSGISIDKPGSLADVLISQEELSLSK
jgi:response regulator RpfG family c-di-GMP phosphodiesterase